MMRDFRTLYAVRPEHATVHESLLTWARLVRVNAASSEPTPMFKHYRSSEVWEADYLPIPIDRLAGWKMEKSVRNLPEKHRDAIRWFYVFRHRHPGAVARKLGLTVISFEDHVHNGRAILKNRG